MTVLGPRRALLVLDNCEHLIDAAAELADRVLVGCPDVRILATSREALGITGETVWPVPPLPVPAAGASGPADVAGYAAARLLRDRAAAVRPGFEVTAANAADVARICRMLDGMPLAIELAAARLSSLSPAQLAERLGDRFGLLTGGSRTAAARHKTLRAVVDWSWSLLAPAERALARRMSVHPGGVTLSATEQACADGPALGPAVPASAVVDAVRGLVDKSLLTVEEAADADAEPRYRMLETVREYGLERLAEAGEATGTRRQMCEYYLRLAQRAEPLLRTAAQRRWFNTLSAERENTHAALRWAIDRQDAAAAHEFTRALGWYWLLSGPRGDRAALARGVLDLDRGRHGSAEPAGLEPRPDRMPAEARAICALIAISGGWAWNDDVATGDLGQALAAAQEEEEAAGRPSHPIVSVGAALVATLTGRHQEALDLVAVQSASEDPWLRAAGRLMHSFFAFGLGRMAEAREDCEQALAGFRQIGELWGTAMTLMQRAEMARLRGDFTAAIASLEEGVALGGELAAWEDLAQIYGNLGGLRMRVGDFERAAADLDRAEESSRAHGETGVYVRLLRAELIWQQGNLAGAVDLCERLLAELARRQAAMWHPLRALTQARLGVLELERGDTERAGQVLKAALDTAARISDRPTMALVAEGLAGLAVATGEAARGASLLGAAEVIRGGPDHSSLDVPAVRRAALEALDAAALDAAYHEGLALGYDEAVALVGAA